MWSKKKKKKNLQGATEASACDPSEKERGEEMQRERGKLEKSVGIKEWYTVGGLELKDN